MQLFCTYFNRTVYKKVRFTHSWTLMWTLVCFFLSMFKGIFRGGLRAEMWLCPLFELSPCDGPLWVWARLERSQVWQTWVCAAECNWLNRTRLVSLTFCPFAFTLSLPTGLLRCFLCPDVSVPGWGVLPPWDWELWLPSWSHGSRLWEK